MKYELQGMKLDNLDIKIQLRNGIDRSTSLHSETIPSPHFHTPPIQVDQPYRRRILTIQPIGRLVSNPVECDFTLSSHLADTANHSLSLSYLEWEVPRELLLHRSELIPPPVLGTE